MIPNGDDLDAMDTYSWEIWRILGCSSQHAYSLQLFVSHDWNNKCHVLILIQFSSQLASFDIVDESINIELHEQQPWCIFERTSSCPMLSHVTHSMSNSLCPVSQENKYQWREQGYGITWQQLWYTFRLILCIELAILYTQGVKKQVPVMMTWAAATEHPEPALANAGTA